MNISRIIQIDLRLLELENQLPTENNKSSVWERRDLMNERKKIIPSAILCADFLRMSHPSRF